MYVNIEMCLATVPQMTNDMSAKDQATDNQ